MILLLDKPPGLSANAALQRVKHLYHSAKAGHAGALDPLATGMLPIAFGAATRINQFLLQSSKAYSATLLLGETRDSADIQGALLSQGTTEHLTEQHIQQALAPFRGTFQQTPPVYSALKHQGKPLYYYARRGQPIRKPARQVTIHQLTLQNCQLPYIDLFIECSKGTYIRSLADDLGAALGCGACLSALHRHWVAPFNQEPCYSLEQLHDMSPSQRQAALLPSDAPLQHLPHLTLKRTPLQRYLHGQNQPLDTTTADGLYRIYYNDDTKTTQPFIGIGQVCSQQLRPNTLLCSIDHLMQRLQTAP